jgi:hypothetical protein
VVTVSRLILTALGVLLVLAVLLVVFMTWGIRLIRRRVDPWRYRFLPPGPRRDAAALRARLDEELRATRDMLEAAPEGVIFRADAARVLSELVTTAAAIDQELAAIMRFIDPAQLRTALTTITPQVNRLIDTTYTARQTILRTAVEDRERTLAALQTDVAKQAAALENYRRDGRELSL